MAPRAFWFGFVGFIVLGGLGAVGQNAFQEGSWEKGLAQVATAIGVIGFVYMLWLWEGGTPRLVKAYEAGQEPSRLMRVLVPRPLRGAWVRSAIEARDRGMRKWEARNADQLSALRLAGHRPQVTATHKSVGEGSRWVLGVRCTGCDLTYPEAGDHDSVLSADVPCPRDHEPPGFRWQL